MIGVLLVVFGPMVGLGLVLLLAGPVVRILEEARRG